MARSELNTALMRLPRRADRVDGQTLLATFVDAGPVVDLVSVPDHQIIYGRRGTGKTHLLSFLGEKVKESGDLSIYVDLRTIGSDAAIYAAEDEPPGKRATRLVIDVLKFIFNEIQDLLLTLEFPCDRDFASVAAWSDRLGDSLVDTRILDGSFELQEEAAASINHSHGSNLGGYVSGSPGIRFSGDRRSERRGEYRARVTSQGATSPRLSFQAVADSLRGLLDAMPGAPRLWFLLDEWSSLPKALQPYLADALKRSILPVSSVTLKIGAIEQRSSFTTGSRSDRIGFELGADIAADANLDEFMVFGNNANKAKEFFATLLYKHVASDSSLDYASADKFINAAFTQDATFDEFVRAAEGVPRDAINIAIMCATRADKMQIAKPHVRYAARTWFERDKLRLPDADETILSLLDWIMTRTIRERRARSFLVKQGHPLLAQYIQPMFDERIIHLTKRGYSSKVEPGIRYDVYSLDYGCYVHLLGTSAAPILGIEEGFDVSDGDVAEAEVGVPIDDMRSIRRAILDLDEYARSVSDALP